jgi:hypothetical protein
MGVEQEHDLGGNEWSTSDRYFTHIEMALPLTLRCHGLGSADFLQQIIIGTALILTSFHSPSLRAMLLSGDSRTCDRPGSMAFHDVPFLGQVY